MGLSVGWGDVYAWDLPDQYVEVTDLAPGQYRLLAVADPSGWFAEQSDTNNTTWLILYLDDRSARPLDHPTFLSLAIGQPE
jgi:hypothetical protein